jgi:hypothetical protein
MRKVRKNFAGYPGDGYRLAICDLCGTKRHIKDMQFINADYNRFNGSFICKEHHRPTHPQDVPFTYEPDVVQQFEYVRDRAEPPRMQPVVNSNSLPGAPQQLRVSLNSLTGYIQLNWLGPRSTGSSPIIGYQIQVSIPQYINYTVLLLNTNNPDTMYLDMVSSISVPSTYKVAAISELGMGPFSNDAPFPTNIDNIDLTYIVDDLFEVITGDDGTFWIGG